MSWKNTQVPAPPNTPEGVRPQRTLVLPPRLLGRTVAALQQALADMPPTAVLALHTADP